MKRNRGKRPVYRKVDFEEELDLDKVEKGRLIALAVAGGLLVIGLAAAFFLFFTGKRIRTDPNSWHLNANTDSKSHSNRSSGEGNSEFNIF